MTSAKITDLRDVTNKDIYALIQNVLDKNIQIQNEIRENREELKQELRALKEKFETQIENLNGENKSLKEENNELKTKLNILERKTKKYNLIFYGIKEEDNKIDDYQRVIQLINENLKIQCTFNDLRDINRIGSEIKDKIRPIVVEVINYHLKSEILSSSKKLKGTGIYVTPDYSKSDYNDRKILSSYLKSAKQLDLQAYISNNKLFIGEDEFTIDYLKKQTPKQILEARTDKQALVEIDNHNTVKGHREEEGTGSKRKHQGYQNEGKSSKRPTRLNSKSNQTN